MANNATTAALAILTSDANVKRTRRLLGEAWAKVSYDERRDDALRSFRRHLFDVFSEGGLERVAEGDPLAVALWALLDVADVEYLVERLWVHFDLDVGQWDEEGVIYDDPAWIEYGDLDPLPPFEEEARKWNGRRVAELGEQIIDAASYYFVPTCCHCGRPSASGEYHTYCSAVAVENLK